MADDPFGLKRSLFMLTDPDLAADEAIGRARAGIRGGATHVVVRRSGDVPAEIFRIAMTLSPAEQEQASWRMLIHERVDIALMTSASGTIHPGNGIPGVPAKELLGAIRMMGRSVHSLGQAQEAEELRADFVLYGNVFETESHPGKPGAGLEMISHIARNVSIPVIAIGGITAERVDVVLAAGASGVAVIRAISRADEPVSAAQAIREELDAASYTHLH